MNMNFFDLHCDTITECYQKNQSILKNEFAIDVNRGKATFDKWVQTFAFWIPDNIDSDSAYRLFLKQYDYFKSFNLPSYEKNNNLDFCTILMVEGGSLLGRNIDRVNELKKRNIKLLTLTWNGENEIASGAEAVGGLKSFGKKLISKLEEDNIVIDVSHLNEESFWDVAKIAKKSFVATHSNAFSVCSHRRNLKDDQIKAIKHARGIIGLNFYKLFLSNDCKDGIYELSKHIDHFLKLGCEDILAIGSDFDGACMPNDFKDITALVKLRHYMLQYYGENITNKIMFDNAAKFFEKTFN